MFSVMGDNLFTRGRGVGTGRSRDPVSGSSSCRRGPRVLACSRPPPIRRTSLERGPLLLIG